MMREYFRLTSDGSDVGHGGIQLASEAQNSNVNCLILDDSIIISEHYRLRSRLSMLFFNWLLESRISLGHLWGNQLKNEVQRDLFLIRTGSYSFGDSRFLDTKTTVLFPHPCLACILQLSKGQKKSNFFTQIIFRMLQLSGRLIVIRSLLDDHETHKGF